MNYKLFIYAAAVLTLGLTACNKDEAVETESFSADAVRINATVGNLFAETRSNPVGNADEQAKFNVGDDIRVVARASDDSFDPIEVIYQYDGTKWTPKDEKFLTWKSDNLIFDAFYPSETGKSVGIVDTDQSTLEKIAMCDWMTAEISNATKGQVLNFAMKRMTSRIVVNIAGFNPEFAADAKVADVKIVDQSDATPRTIEPATTYTDYIPYPQGDGSVGSTYTLLRSEYMRYQYISLKVGNKEMRTAILNSDFESGKSYTFNLKVGKERIEIESVTVSDWSNSVTIPGGSAGESL